MFRLELGPVGFLSVPGELLPELAWGFPTDDPRWAAEVADSTARGPGATYFSQQDPDCAALDGYEACREELEVDDCDCLTLHAWPYRLSEDDDLGPMIELLDTEYRAMIGMSDSYYGYIIPEPDFNRATSLFTDDGDHYEDTVSGASVFGDRVLEAHHRLAERW